METPFVDINGYLEFPLYHGTSSIFIESILKQGLGASRPKGIFDINILQNLADELSNKSQSTEWWQANSLIIEKMIAQKVTQAGFNFCYCGTYFSPSRSTAVNYANNVFGSELISEIFFAHKALHDVNPKAALKVIPNSHALHELFNKKHQPIILKTSYIKASSLRTEQGESVEQQLKGMIRTRDSFPPDELEIIWQQFNFELIGKLNREEFEVEWL